MPDGSSKVFTLAQANQLVPVVAELTAEVVENLNQVRGRYKLGTDDPISGMSDEILKEIEELLRRWSERITELGAHPKGYFTVDFQSLDPEMLYCWSYGEDRISFVHKVWENFSHRRPLVPGMEPASDHLKWVN